MDAEAGGIGRLSGVIMRVAIVGSGPAGFYAAEALLKRADTVIHVDMFDRLPTPFGLVRGGVAPDHQRMKTITRSYEKTAERPSFRFLGNVCLGRDLSVEDLTRHYQQIVYAVGSESDRRLGIPGEGTIRSTPSSVFVGWYNGHPDYRPAKIDLSVPRVAVIGNGNVALDISRILLRNPDELAKTDIADHALEALRNSKVREVFVIGRRGPLQASFTPKELHELGEMEGVDVVVRSEDLAACEGPQDDPQKQQIADILREFHARPQADHRRKLHLWFLRSPTEIIADASGVAGIRLEKTRLEERLAGPLAALGTGAIEELPVGMVLSAIGFAAQPIDGVPFDDKRLIIANEDGRVVRSDSRTVVPGQYVVGWARTGPQGLIGSHKGASAHVVEHMIADTFGLPSRDVRDAEAIMDLLRSRLVQAVSFADWKQLDDVETARGERRGAPRDKITDIEAMLSLLGQE
jgi:ferredoxin/flavodoxin---NADP+ reductase